MRRVVVHLSANRYPPLPARHGTLDIWRELARDADEYHVIARAEGPHASHTREGSIHLHLVPSFVRSQSEFLLTMWVAFAYALRVRPSLVVAQCPVLGGLVALLLARVRRAPLWVELHGSHYFRAKDRSPAGRFFQAMAGPVLRGATRVRALSRQMRDDLAAQYGAALAARTVVVPTRVDLALFTPPKADYALHDPPRLTAVGAFAPVKNHLGLLEVLARAAFPFRLTLVGDGPLRPAYEQAIARLGLGDRVHLAHWVPQSELAQVLRETDVYVHSSAAEAMPRAVLEAMAMGLPVVATNVGYVAEIIEHGVEGELVANPVDAALLQAVERLLHSADRRAALGRAAFARVQRQFEWHAAFAAYRGELYGLL